MYVAVKGGEKAIAAAHELLAKERRGDLAVPEIGVDQIAAALRLPGVRQLRIGLLPFTGRVDFFRLHLSGGRPGRGEPVGEAGGRRRQGRLDGGDEVLGGAATGLASVTLVGLWLGFSPPTGLAGMADGVLGTSLSGSSTVVDQVDLLPNFETYLAEG